MKQNDFFKYAFRARQQLLARKEGVHIPEPTFFSPNETFCASDKHYAASKKQNSQSLPDPIVTSPFAGATTDVGDAYTPKYLAVTS